MSDTTKVTIALPADVAEKLWEKYQANPEAFKKYMKAGGFDIQEMRPPKMDDEKCNSMK